MSGKTVTMLSERTEYYIPVKTTLNLALMNQLDDMVFILNLPTTI